MLSDAPPSFDEFTTSCTWRECTDVKTVTNSGMIAPASVPQLMMHPSFHQSVSLPARVGTMKYETTNVSAMEMNDVSHTRLVSGFSKFISSASPYLAFAMASLTK